MYVLQGTPGERQYRKAALADHRKHSRIEHRQCCQSAPPQINLFASVPGRPWRAARSLRLQDRAPAPGFATQGAGSAY